MATAGVTTRRPRGEQRSRRDVQRHPSRAAAAVSEGQPVHRPRRSDERPAPARRTSCRPGKDGDGDPRRRRTTSALCLTDVPENRVPFDQARRATTRSTTNCSPAGSRTSQGAVQPGPSKIAPIGCAGRIRISASASTCIPNRKTDSNYGSEFGTDYSAAAGTGPRRLREREKHRQEHKDTSPGCCGSWQRSARAPGRCAARCSEWGLAKDEFTENGNLPHQLYVREARRMVSDYVMTEHDAWARRRADEVVALASYTLDSHGVTLLLRRRRARSVARRGSTSVPASSRSATAPSVPRAASAQPARRRRALRVARRVRPDAHGARLHDARPGRGNRREHGDRPEDDGAGPAIRRSSRSTARGPRDPDVEGNEGRGDEGEGENTPQ